METDRCPVEVSDLLIPRIEVATASCPERGEPGLLGVSRDRAQHVGILLDGEVHPSVVVDPGLPEARAPNGYGRHMRSPVNIGTMRYGRLYAANFHGRDDAQPGTGLPSSSAKIISMASVSAPA